MLISVRGSRVYLVRGINYLVIYSLSYFNFIEMVDGKHSGKKCEWKWTGYHLETSDAMTGI